MTSRLSGCLAFFWPILEKLRIGTMKKLLVYTLSLAAGLDSQVLIFIEKATVITPHVWPQYVCATPCLGPENTAC